jgi:uncharacterized protein YggE
VGRRSGCAPVFTAKPNPNALEDPVTRLASSRRFPRLALALGLAAAPLAACSNPPQVVVHTDDKDVVQPGQLVVTGTATLDVSPDIAELTMTITGDAMRPGAAVDEVRKKQARLIAELKKQGLAEEDLKLSMLGIDPVYEYIEHRSVLKGFRARITITASTTDFAKVGGLMESGANAGVTEMSSQFRRSDLAELKKKVRDSALQAARDKAKQTAIALGIELGRVTMVAEQSQSYMWTRDYFPNTYAVANNAPAAVLGGVLQPLQLDITVTYELPEKA